MAGDCFVGLINVHNSLLDLILHFDAPPGSRREYTGQNGVHTPGSASPDSPRIRLRMQSARASNLLEELQSVLADQAEDNKRKVFQQLPYDLQDFLKQWVVRDKQQYHQVGE